MSLKHMIHAGLVTCEVGLPTIAESILGRVQRSACDARLDRWSKALVDAARISIEVHGKHHMQGDEAFVVISNHQSHYDIPVLFQSYDKPIRMVAKRELFRIPVMGAAMRAAGFPELDRQRRERAIQSLSAASRALGSGMSIWIAPEGTRSVDGRLAPFKKGGFRMAIDARARILPVTIDGTRRTLVAKGRKVNEGQTVRVTFSEPVDTSGVDREHLTLLMDRVRGAIAQHLEV
ncbi:MAG: 1-acyl-sn-glycerol-3-phosphate acyltransferase [Myxococcales bacterium]|nr:1-acyl-sn-glycerol-3-phosphate acyltransferase [Myxococcales bacterium]